MSPAVQWIPYLYMYVDEPEKTLAIADRWSGEARARGSAVMACFAETLRAECLRRMGLLVDSLGAAEVAWGIATELGRGFPGWWISLSAVAQELVATGEPGRALELLGAAGVLEGPPPEIMLLPCPRVVRAECLTAAGHKERGVEELLAAWQWLDDMNEPSPGAWHFPALLVDGLLLMDRREEAADIAARWLARTEAFGARTTIGMAQRSLALTRSGPEQIEGLAAAERTLSGCPSASEHARALVELGSALRRAARRTEAREPLRQGLDRASRCGAKLLAARAAEELSATGARPRRIALTGVDSLSPGERRVAQLAAKGLTNREIASTLFLSRKTVEHHLGSIYTKLGTNERSRLATLIDGA